MTDYTLAQRLRTLRGKRTLRQLAEQTGLSVSYLSDLERGRTEPSLSTLVRLADAHEVRVVDILRGLNLGERRAKFWD